MFLDTKQEDKILSWMVASILQVQAALNFFMNAFAVL